MKFESIDGVIRPRDYAAKNGGDSMYKHGWTHYFESADGYQQGMICFDGDEVVDYDGVFELPTWVKEALLAEGFHGEFTIED